MSLTDVWVVVPVYNEQRTVATTVSDLLQAFDHVLCVDDGSCARHGVVVDDEHLGTWHVHDLLEDAREGAGQTLRPPEREDADRDLGARHGTSPTTRSSHPTVTVGEPAAPPTYAWSPIPPGGIRRPRR